MQPRLSTPRIPPLEEKHWEDPHREVLAKHRRPIGNIFRTLVRHPKLLKRWQVFGNHVLFKQSLPARERELLILRTGWNCQAAYEWEAHVRIGKRAGLTDEDIDRIKQGPDAPGLAPMDATLLRAADELRADAMISGDTWQRLNEHFNEQQLMDLVFTVGQYTMVSMALNSLGVQLDATPAEP